jgi:effector-binding domain-containing protein
VSFAAGGGLTRKTRRQEEITDMDEQPQVTERAAQPFIRYHVIDMDAELEIEIAAPVAAAVPGSGRVQAGELPAGRYVTLVHTGPYNGLVAANAALQDWARDQGISLECSQDGHRFRGRVEFYPTDPREEPDTAKWQVEIAYLISQGSA